MNYLLFLFPIIAVASALNHVLGTEEKGSNSRLGSRLFWDLKCLGDRSKPTFEYFPSAIAAFFRFSLQESWRWLKSPPAHTLQLYFCACLLAWPMIWFLILFCSYCYKMAKCLRRHSQKSSNFIPRTLSPLKYFASSCIRQGIG